MTSLHAQTLPRDGETSYDVASDFFASSEYQQILEAPAESFDEELDKIRALEHRIYFAEGRYLSVVETFTLRSWFRFPHRAVMFTSGAFSNADLWRIPVQGYNGAEMAAQRGMFAFTVDLIGIGKSYRPADGLESTSEANIAALEEVLHFIRTRRAVPKVDIISESWSVGMATHLARKQGWVRSVVMSSTVYKNFANPVGGASIEALDSLPGHYLPTNSAFYQGLVFPSPTPVQNFVFDSQPGLYPITQSWDLAMNGLPLFDPSGAKAPGLYIIGSNDPVSAPQDPYDFVSEYGRRGARLKVIEGGGHLPRAESQEIATEYWNAVWDFIDP